MDTGKNSNPWLVIDFSFVVTAEFILCIKINQKISPYCHDIWENHCFLLNILKEKLMFACQIDYISILTSCLESCNFDLNEFPTT